MAETGQRPSLLVVVPPPIWALLFLLAGWGVGAAFGLPPVVGSPFGGSILAVGGFAVALWGRLTFARAGAEILPVSPVNSVLVTHGPFAFTRNPMYLGILTFMAGLALWLGTIAALSAVVVYFVFVNLISIPFEEAKMERQYGDQFRAYTARVRRWL